MTRTSGSGEVPLPEAVREQAAAAMKLLPINYLFAWAVLEGSADGTVLVDSVEDPRAFYVKHNYGMSLLYGDTAAIEDWGQLWDRFTGYSGLSENDEWLQAWPEASITRVSQHLGLEPGDGPEVVRSNLAERHIRVNFIFESEPSDTSAAGNASIVRTGAREYEALQGFVHPRFFWPDRETFLRDGIGFSKLVDGEVASTAFSAFIRDRQLELGIETAAGHRGKGYAYGVCRQLIRYCLDNGLEPVWACRLGNTGSMKLAQKLGFKDRLHIPYFRLLAGA